MPVVVGGWPLTGPSWPTWVFSDVVGVAELELDDDEGLKVCLERKIVEIRTGEIYCLEIQTLFGLSVIQQHWCR